MAYSIQKLKKIKCINILLILNHEAFKSLNKYYLKNKNIAFIDIVIKWQKEVNNV